MFGKDITERKKIEEVLRENQKKYQDLIETTYDFIWEMDSSGRYTYCSPQMEKLWGLKPAEMIGKTPFDMMPPGEKERISELFKGAANSPKPFSGLQTTSYDSQGRLIFVETNGVPFFDDQGRLLGFRGMSRDNTERKKAEEALKRSEERFRCIFEGANDGILGADPETKRFVFANPAMRELTGYSLDELTKLGVGDIHPKKDLPHVLDEIGKQLKGETTLALDMPVLKKGGQIVYCDINSRLITLENREVMAGFFRDITERKRMREALQESEGRLRNVVENSSDQIFMLDRDYRFLVANKSAADLFGISPQKMVGRSISEIFPETIAAQFAKNIKNVFDAGKSMFIDEKIVATGRELYISTSLNPVINDKGRVIAVTGIVRDITERKKVEELLNKKQRELDRILDSSPTIIFYKDKEGRFIQANRAFGEALHVLKEQLLGKTVFDLYSAEIAQAMTNDDLEVMKSKRPKIGIVEPYESSTGLRWIRTDKIPSFDENGDVTGLIGFSEDITERKKLEKQLQDQERLATIGATAGMVGHDIRNPLQAIFSDTFLLRLYLNNISECKDKEGIVESLDSIEKNVTYINKIVQDLQDYAKPIVPVAQETDFESVISDVLVKKAIPKNIDASFDIQKDASRVIADPSLLKRILTNLVNNAIQAMPDGGKLTIRTYRDGGHIVLTVEDSGTGIPEEIKPRLFTPLFTTKSKGQGFGLAVVKRMSEALGGTVSFESEKGKGTKFIVRLPPQKKTLNGKWTFK